MKLLRKAIVVALTVLLFAGVYAGGAAIAAPETQSPGAIAIQLNGKHIEFPSGVEPYFDNEAGRVFVPVRDLFAELGAEVAYDEASRVITLTRGPVTVVFPQDSTTITITAGGVSATIESDVKPITVDNRVLVPLRFVANALGCSVGWDQAAQTAIVIDPALYLAANTETYDILGKLLEIESAQPEGNQASTVTIEGSVSYNGSSIPLSLKIEGISSPTVSDTKISGKVTLPPDAAQLLPGLSAELSISADVLFNAETGLFALHSELLNALALGMAGDAASDTWLTADLYELFKAQGVDVEALLAQAESGEFDLNSLINGILAQQIAMQMAAIGEPSSVDDFAATIGTTVSLFNAMIGDSSFKETDDGYISEFSLDEGGVGVNSSIKITLDKDGKAESLSMDMSVKENGTVIMEEKLTVSAGKLDGSIVLSAEGVEIDLVIKGETSPTTEEPRTELPEGAVTEDLGALLAAQVGGAIAEPAA
jgi:hypothetical protein